MGAGERGVGQVAAFQCFHQNNLAGHKNAHLVPVLKAKCPQTAPILQVLCSFLSPSCIHVQSSSVSVPRCFNVAQVTNSARGSDDHPLSYRVYG